MSGRQKTRRSASTSRGTGTSSSHLRPASSVHSSSTNRDSPALPISAANWMGNAALGAASSQEAAPKIVTLLNGVSAVATIPTADPLPTFTRMTRPRSPRFSTLISNFAGCTKFVSSAWGRPHGSQYFATIRCLWRALARTHPRPIRVLGYFNAARIIATISVETTDTTIAPTVMDTKSSDSPIAPVPSGIAA